MLMVSLLAASILMFVLATFARPASAQDTCTGRFLNPITDICWECTFPITLGGATIAGGPTDTKNPSSPICFCGVPIPRVGIAVGFWEPVRLFDASRRPGCFSNLGGLEINLGKQPFGATSHTSGSSGKTTMHAHYYHYPVWSLLEALIDTVCLDPGNIFDIAWITELDPTWLDDELTALFHPESAFFGNILAQAACAADCVAATLGLPLDELFWCAGCQGGMYPMTGNVTAHVGGVQAALLTSQKLLYKLHRLIIAWGTYGQGALCQRFPMPIMAKRQYRFQLTQPTAITTAALACNPPGRTTVHYEWKGGEIPRAGENFGFLLWRKRNCCLL